jgi:hypothetical protein
MIGQETFDARSTSDRDNQSPKDVAERFGISAFRTEKFDNNDEDSSLVDRCSDHPAVMEAFAVLHEAATSVMLK